MIPAEDATDEALLAHYADASRPAAEREVVFHRLVTRYQRRVFAVCYRVLGSSSDAEDATQETFLRLARNAGSFRGDAKVSTWVYRIARNVSTDHIRYDARRPSTPVDDLTRVGHEPEAEDALAASETAATVRAALAQLDERSRTLLLLVAVEELSYAEAAEVVDLPVGTVKSRVSRARVKLCELLAEPLEAPADLPRTSSDGHPPAPGPGGPSPIRGPPR
jgi:RNA polymerase sigma-70 factor, ECF subfamily